MTGEPAVVLVNRESRRYSLFSLARDRSLKVLTDEQRKAWNELIGKPLDLEPIVGRGRSSHGR